jgi:hypothetical protein
MRLPRTPERDPPHGERGTSLIELMLLLCACVVTIGALMSGIVSLSSEQHLREERLLAINACRNMLEDLRGRPIAELPAADGQGFAVAGMNGEGVGLAPVRGDPDRLPGLVTVRPERTYGSTVLYRVTVSVDWTGASPNAHEEISTLIGRRR